MTSAGDWVGCTFHAYLNPPASHFGFKADDDMIVLSEKFLARKIRGTVFSYTRIYCIQKRRRIQKEARKRKKQQALSRRQYLESKIQDRESFLAEVRQNRCGRGGKCTGLNQIQQDALMHIQPGFEKMLVFLDLISRGRGGGGESMEVDS